MWWSNLFKDMSPASFFNFSFLPKYGVFFVQGVEYTLLLAIVSVSLAVIPAMLLALMRLSRNKVVKTISGAYIAVFRSTPMLVQLSIIYFGLFGVISIPRVTILGFVDLSRFIPGVVALALNSSAYVAEIFRAGILAVDAGQMEAALPRPFQVAGNEACRAASGDKERPPRACKRGRHDGEGELDLLHARHGGAYVRRKGCCLHNVYITRALYTCGAYILLHKLSRFQGYRSGREEDAPWRQAVSSSA